MDDRAAELTVLAVTAHPDDEAFGVSGMLAKYGASGVRTGLICVTRGEAGLSAGLADSVEGLAELRSSELRCSARTIGIDELYLLDHPDGGGAGWDMAGLKSQLAGLISAIGPQVVVTFDDQGITRHPDHIAVHSAVRGALEDASDCLGVSRLFYQVLPCGDDPGAEGRDLACVPPDGVDVIVDVGAFEPVKRAALRCHRTQAADTEWMLSREEGSLKEEYYMLGWAANDWRPGPGETDLLAGLR